MSWLIQRVPAPAPSVAVVLAGAGEEDRPVVLASGPGDPALAGWSYAALEPVAIAAFPAADSFAAFSPAPPGLPPFCGGAIGYVGYDLGWSYQARPRVPRGDPLGMPGSRFFVYDAIYARSEVSGEGVIVGHASARGRFDRLCALVRAGAWPAVSGSLRGALSPGVSRAVHMERVRECLRLIEEGEIYQVNLTYPLVGEFGGSPIAAFLRVLEAPPPFAALMRVDRDQWIVSASPECFFDFDARGRELAVYPIKGTRRRSTDPAADAALAAELVRDEKERAEHLMIVDLLRNDLGRIAAIGSVEVRGLAYVESFPQVHHLTSRVRASVPERIGFKEIVEALFPGGSITGVPKLRAMEIIDHLEGEARGVYTGLIGYVGANGSARASIAIRTAQIRGTELRFGVGGGIVADSTPENEWTETEIKAKALTKALKG